MSVSALLETCLYCFLALILYEVLLAVKFLVGLSKKFEIISRFKTNYYKPKLKPE